MLNTFPKIQNFFLNQPDSFQECIITFPGGSSNPQSSRWEQGRNRHWTLHPMVMTTSTSGMSDKSLLCWVYSMSMP